MYVQHEMRKDLLVERSPAKSEGVVGLRKFLFQPANGADEVWVVKREGLACFGPVLG